MNTIGDAKLGRIVLWVILALFSLNVIANVAQHPLDANDTQIDEQAHLSYALHLIDHDRWWPDFDHFMMYNLTNGQELARANYMNHPPTFYWLAKLAHAAIPALTLADYRNGALVMTLLGITLYGLIGIRFDLPLAATVVYALLPWMIYVHKQVGFYNNDCFAMLGGLTVTCGSLLWFGERKIHTAFWLVLLGLGLASVKLTAFLLVGLYAAACMLLKRTNLRHLSWHYWLIGCLVGIILLLPYMHLILLTGSPAPETLGQKILMTQHPDGPNWTRVLIQGWIQEPRMRFLPWLIKFLHGFAVQLEQYDTTFIPLLLIGFLLLRSTIKKLPIPATTTAMLRAGLIATALTFLTHVWFAWGRYQQYGWQLDSGLRYYYPLLAVYGAACGTAISSVSRSKQELV